MSVAPSTAHRHVLGSPCLVPVDEVPNQLGHLPADDLSRREDMVTREPGWFRCSETIANPITRAPYWVHDHGGRLVSHYPDRADRRATACPSK